MDGLDPRPRITVEALAAALEDPLVGGADVEQLGVVVVGEPEHLIDALRELPKPSLALAQRFLRLLALGDI